MAFNLIFSLIKNKNKNNFCYFPHKRDKFTCRHMYIYIVYVCIFYTMALSADWTILPTYICICVYVCKFACKYCKYCIYKCIWFYVRLFACVCVCVRVQYNHITAREFVVSSLLVDHLIEQLHFVAVGVWNCVAILQLVFLWVN